MEEKSVKSEFLAKCEKFSKEISESINTEKGDKKAIIIIAAEGSEDDTLHCNISVCGRREELIIGVENFLNNEEKLVKSAIALGLVRKLKS